MDEHGLPKAVHRGSPLPRINAAMVIRQNLLYLYGGLLEIGDREVTMDDFWVLDIVKREGWTCLFEGSMHLQVWKGVSSDTESCISQRVEIDGSDDEEDDEGSDNDNDNDLLEEEEEEEEEIAPSSKPKGEETEEERKERKTQKKERKAREAEANSKADDSHNTPLKEEALADFFARTRPYWTETALAFIKNEQGEDAEEPSSKELKRAGFALASETYIEFKGDEAGAGAGGEGEGEDDDERREKKSKKDKKEKKDKKKD